MKSRLARASIGFFLLCLSTALFAGAPPAAITAGNGLSRDSYYNNISSVFGFSKVDITAIRKSGFSPDYSLVLLAIAKKAGVPVDKMISLRSENGYSWKDMCDEYGIDYYALMDGLEKTLIDKNIIPPLATAGESKRNAASNRRHKKGAGQ
jgi:hypothetical protein